MESRAISVQPPECVYLHWPGNEYIFLEPVVFSESDLEMNPLCRFALAQGQHFSKSNDLNLDLKYKIMGLC